MIINGNDNDNNNNDNSNHNNNNNNNNSNNNNNNNNNSNNNNSDDDIINSYRISGINNWKNVVGGEDRVWGQVSLDSEWGVRYLQ